MSEIRTSLRITYPRIPAHKATEEYFESKTADEGVKLPGSKWDEARSDPDLELVVARRLYFQTLKNLEKRRLLYKEERVSLNKQWEELKEQERDFKKTFSNMNTFILTNGDKRTRAKERLAEDTILVAEQIKKTEDIKKKIEFLEKNKQIIEKEVRMHLFYEKFLNNVVASSQLEFKNADGIVDRYESLNGTKNELALNQEVKYSELEKTKNNFTRLAEDKNFEILALNTKLSELRATYQKTHGRAIRCERLVNSIRSWVLLKYTEMVEVKQSCRNIYMIMCKRKNETPKIKEEDFERQLIYIKRTLRQLTAVRTHAEAVTKKKVTSTKGETSKASS